MRLALVDDDAAQTDHMASLIQEELAALGYARSVVDTFDNAASFLAAEREHGYDIAVLDIFMEGIDGIAAAQAIRRTGSDLRLVFCTTSNEFASESYALNASYYLRKPITREGVARMLARLDLDRLDRTRSITLDNGTTVLVRCIVMTNYSNHVVTLTLASGETVRVRTSQTRFEETLAPYGCFFSPVKGMIVNFHEVVRLEGDEFVMSNGTRVHITRRRMKEARSAFTHFRFEAMKREALRR